MKKIVILNAYGRKNIGDEAILSVSLKMIDSSLRERALIQVLCVDISTIPNYSLKNSEIVPLLLPYGYAIKSTNLSPRAAVKIGRFFYLLLTASIFMGISLIVPAVLPKKGTFSFIRAIKEADTVIGMGGGYFITPHPWKDYFGLILSLLLLWQAKLYKKSIFLLPMSIGPFASKMHGKIVGNALKNTRICCREKISFDTVKRITKNDRSVNSHLIPDLALFCKWTRDMPIEQKLKGRYMVITAREWLSRENQKEYEKVIASIIEYAWKTYGLKTKFIVMAHNLSEDDDGRVAERIKKILKNRNILDVVYPRDHKEVQQLLFKAKIAVCTRMHSSILAATVDTPFILIGYAHKSKGFIEDLNLEKWHIDIHDVSTHKLSQMFDELLEPSEYNSFTKQLNKKINEYSVYPQQIHKLLRQYLSN